MSVINAKARVDKKKTLQYNWVGKSLHSLSSILVLHFAKEYIFQLNEEKHWL